MFPSYDLLIRRLVPLLLYMFIILSMQSIEKKREKHIYPDLCKFIQLTPSIF